MSSTNLFVLSKFKDWDVELAGNGLNYPLQRVFSWSLARRIDGRQGIIRLTPDTGRNIG